MTPYFSVVIPTLNEEVNLPVLLNSIYQNHYEQLEVIISDNVSKDNTRNKAMEFKDKIKNLYFLEHKSKNVSQARNFGASHAKGEFIVFFDSDVEIEKSFFVKIAQEIEKYNVDTLTVWNRAKNNDIRGIILWGLLNLSMTLSQHIKPAANGPCIIIKMELFEKINGFDETIVFGEDFDLTQRAVKEDSKFKVFSTPILYVSTRRFKQEGFFVSLYKSFKAILYQLLFGPIRKPIFEYEMGGQNFKKEKGDS